MSHAHQGGQAPDQPSSGRQTGAAAHTRTDHSQGTHTAASPLTSHTRHGDNQAVNGPRQTNPPTLTVPRPPRTRRYERLPTFRYVFVTMATREAACHCRQLRLEVERGA